MPKNIEDIITPENRKSIRNIPIPDGRKKNTKLGPEITPPNLPPVNRERIVPISMRSKKSSRKLFWASSLVGILFIAFLVLLHMAGGTLVYTPKSAPLSFNKDVYLARKSGEDALLFSVVKLSQDQGMQVAASGESEVSRRAHGTIVVYNTTSTKPEKLDENTRFETPDGKWYRIQNSITIPGKKTVSGAEQPGSIEAVVYADQPGESYNIGLADFTLPGYKGTKKQDTIYARSKTPMTGGFVGKEKVVNQDDLASTKKSLETALINGLVAEAGRQVPEDFILFPVLSAVTYEDLPQSGQTDNSVTINMRGNLTAVIFERDDLSTHLASKKTTVAPGELVEIENFETLTLILSSSTPVDLLKTETLHFEVNGNALAVWQTDETALKSDLAGKSKKDVETIVKNYPSIISTEAVVRPFWKTSFPSDTMRITLKKLLSK